MKYCSNCGTKITGEEKVCSNCGEAVETANPNASTTEVDDVKQNKAMAILSYFGLLVLIPFFSAKNSKFASFHAKQGMNLLIFWVGYVVLSILTSFIKVKASCGTWLGMELGNYCYKTPIWVTLPVSLIGMCISVFAVIGIVFAAQGKEKELPIIGKIKIFK